MSEVTLALQRGVRLDPELREILEKEIKRSEERVVALKMSGESKPQLSLEERVLEEARELLKREDAKKKD